MVGAWPIAADRLHGLHGEGDARGQAADQLDAAESSEFEDALNSFIERILASPPFVAELESIGEPRAARGAHQQPGAVAHQVHRAGRARTRIRAANCGTCSLVDPDNRRPVDYELRSRCWLNCGEAWTVDDILRGMDAGLPKLWVVAHARSRCAAIIPSGLARTPITRRSWPMGRSTTTRWGSCGPTAWSPWFRDGR